MRLPLRSDVFRPTKIPARATRAGASFLFLAAFALLAPASAGAQQPAEPVVAASTATESLRFACESFRADNAIVGMSVAVLDHGRVVFAEAFGHADRERAVLATRDTLFRLGSISKPVTATIAAELADEGKLDLGADLRRYAPDLKERLPAMTLADVLSHTAGFRHYRPDRVDNSTTHRTTHEALELFLADPLLSAPRAKYSYSTHGYTVAVDVLEHVTGKTFVELVRARVRDRVAPTLDCEVLTDAKPARSALYEKKGSGKVLHHAVPEDNSWKYGGGGMESTALDLARFADAVRTAKLVTAAGRDRMWSATTLADGSTSNYGLGWRLEPRLGRVMHTGSQQGANSVLVIDGKEERVFVVMTNTLGTKPQELVPRLRELVTRAAAPRPASPR
ncbi:MAG: beta-lactamase family protein [Planctomycetes bacterium]|nr:beta-lactamase family protein [Planctomycetota bacterium]